ncbi:MAG: OmpA family protein [Sulfitobacter sp.]|nr:OmpA family protein [Sulfitobacter sp.]
MIRAALAFFLLAAPAAALELELPPTARQTVERNTAADIYAAPSGVFDGDKVPTLAVEGEIRRAAWRLDSPGLTPLQVMRPLRAQVQAAGYDLVLDCTSSACGGFDFRFATEILPGPNMYVNLRAYHFVTGIKYLDDVPQDVITILASTSATSAYVQVVRAQPADVPAGEPSAARIDPPRPVPAAPDPVGRENLSGQILGQGYAVLEGLDFASGSTDLGPGPFAALEALAAFLRSRPETRIALVGHTDTIGGLQPNISISRARAQSVRARLIDGYKIDPARLDAEGMGYLSPIASNLEPSGREANRRVEAVILTE